MSIDEFNQAKIINYPIDNSNIYIGKGLDQIKAATVIENKKLYTTSNFDIKKQIAKTRYFCKTIFAFDQHNFVNLINIKK